MNRKTKKIITTIGIFVILGLGIYYLIPIKYIGISMPTEEACNVCGDPKGEISYVTYTKTLSGNIQKIKFDTYSNVYEGSKIAYSDAGKYGLKDDPDGGGIKWSDHVRKLENYVIKNDQFPELNKDGKDVDGVSGATIHIDTMLEAYQNAEAKLKIIIFDQKDYSLYKDLLKE